MKVVTKLMIGAAGIAALGVAAPAAAQYPGYGYPYGYQQQPGNIIGQVLQSVLNPYANNQYARVNPQVAAQQCSAAVQQRLAMQYRAGYSGYGYAQSNARVLGITRIDQRSNTTLRVRGTATSGMNYGRYGYGAYGAVGYAMAPDLTFKCDVDYRGYIRDIDIDRRR